MLGGLGKGREGKGMGTCVLAADCVRGIGLRLLTKGKGMERKGKEGNGREGKGREGKGWERKGRKRKGIEVKGKEWVNCVLRTVLFSLYLVDSDYSLKT